MEVERFPVYKAGYIFNKFNEPKKTDYKLEKKNIEILYPCRLDAMAINPAAVCYNDSMVFTPGEVVVKPEIFFRVKIKVTSNEGAELKVSESTKRKVLVRHAYYLMCDALNISPSLEIDVDDNMIPKHCGFGSSSSTIASVAAAINELYGRPISNADLIKYLASNHGEEITDDNEEDLKMVQCIGGGATGGFTNAGIIMIAGKSTTIAKMNYDGDIIIGIPNDFVQKNALELMGLEEENLYKFKKTGEEYAEHIAYNLLHISLPDMANNKIKGLADTVFDYRFNMGSIENCSFVYDNMVNQSNQIRYLYEENKCDFLALSSVGPAYFAITTSDDNKKECIKAFEKANLKIIETKVYNDCYKVVEEDNTSDFWKQKSTTTNFQTRLTSKYITDEIDKIVKNKNLKIIDIGCGGGRYSRYVKEKKQEVIGIDLNKEMFYCPLNKDIPFIECSFDNIPLFDSTFDLALSIGVYHNSVTNSQFENAIKEMYRILKDNSYALLSVFTNDVITDDLIDLGDDLYNIINRPSMVLHSKKTIDDIVKKAGFSIEYKVDEHVTDVGSGKRNVYTILLRK